MNRHFLWSSIVLSLLLTACAVQRPSSRASLPQLPERITLKNFSFLPLDEPGWRRSSQATSVLILVKNGDHTDEAKAIRVDFGHSSSSESDEAFASFIQSYVAKTKAEKAHLPKESPDKRIKLLTNEAWIVEFQGRQCLQSFRGSEDREAVKKTDNSASMRIRIFWTACKHPTKKTSITLGYSERVYAGHEDPAFREKALRLLEGLQFLP